MICPLHLSMDHSYSEACNFGPKPPDGAEQLTDWVDWEPDSISRNGGREMVKQQVGSLFFYLWSLAGMFTRSVTGMGYPETQRLVWSV